MSGRTFKILASCQEDGCRENVSYHMDMLRWWNGEPICDICFENLPNSDTLKPGEPEDGEHIDWSDLDPLLLGEAQP